MTKLDAMNWPSRAACGVTAEFKTTLAPGPPSRTSCPAAADQHVVARAAGQCVVTRAADQHVVAVAAVGGEQHAGQPVRGDDVVAAEAVDDEVILASKFEIVTSAARPETVITPLLLVTLITSLALVALMTTVSTALVVAAKIDVDVLDVGLGEVVHRDGVRPALSVDVDGLHVVEIHGDVADIAGQQGVAAVGRQGHVLGDVGAVEQQCVVARLAVDRVAALARVPDERVVAGAERATSVPRPPMTRSSPWLPMILSSPSPPLIVRLTRPALSAEALMVSLPPSR